MSDGFMPDSRDARNPREETWDGRGWCMKCGRECTVVSDEGTGVCPEHGQTFVNWTPPLPANDE